MEKIILIIILVIVSPLLYSQTAKELIDMATAKVQLDNFAGAISDYTKAINSDPIYLDAYLGRALAKVKLDDFTGAVADYSRAIEIDPSKSEIYVWRGDRKSVV